METKRAKAKKIVVVADREMENTAIWLEALEDFVDKFNDWELKFYESMCDWFVQRGKKLSPRQYESLERLYHRFY